MLLLLKLVRLGVILCAGLLLLYAALELRNPGFLRSDLRMVSLIDVVPHVVFVVMVAVGLLIPPRRFSSRRWWWALVSWFAIAMFGLTFLSGARPTDAFGVFLVMLVYGLPIAAAVGMAWRAESLDSPS